jgi:hypothetical protein
MASISFVGLLFSAAVSVGLLSAPAAGGGICWGSATHPGVVTNLRHEWDACGNRYLAWDPVPGATGYGVCRFPCGLQCGSAVSENLVVSGTVAVDPGVPSCGNCCNYSGIRYEVYAFFPNLAYPADRSCVGAVLSVSGAVPIDQQRVIALPIDPIVCAGSSVVEFRAQLVSNALANGFAYEWKRNGETVATTSSPSLTVPVVSADDGAVYSVRASNGCLSLSAAWPPLDVGAFPPSGPIQWTAFQHSMDEYRFRRNSGWRWGPCGQDMCSSYESLDGSSFSRACPHDQLSSIGASISVQGYRDTVGWGGGNNTCSGFRDYRRWERWTGTFTTTRERAVSVRGSVTSTSGATVVEVFENGIIVRTLSGGSVDEVLTLGPGIIRIDARSNIPPGYGYDRVQLDLEVLPPADDCNLNDVSDVIDIASGTSPDIDSNGTPDECQTVTVPGQYPTIQAAIDAAPVDSMRVVAVAPGIHPGPVAFNGKPVVVRGTAGAASTVIDGSSGQQLSVVRFTGGEPAIAALERVTVRGGATGSPLPVAPQFLVGGGILSYNSAASIRDCVIEQNVAPYGAGAYVWNSTGAIERCTFRGNSAGSDGGGAQLYGGSPRMVDCVVENNACAGRGGGLHLVEGTQVLLRTVVRNNQSGDLVGGVSWVPVVPSAASLRMEGCDITGNAAAVAQGGVGVLDGTDSTTCALQATDVCGNSPLPNFVGRYLDLGGNTICRCRADLTSDGQVDGTDLGVLLGAWGPASPATPADLNDDGSVDGADLGTLLNFWGPCP